MLKSLPLLPLLLCLGCSDSDASTQARVFFVGIEDGATVKSPLLVKFDVEGKECVPKETHKGDDKFGHHHIMVDHDIPIPKGDLVPDDAAGGYFHYGAAQSEATLTLTPGQHTLTLQFADAMHISYGPELAKTITITIVE